MAIRKLTYAPEESAPQPSAEIVKDFIMSPGTLRLEVSLDKEASLAQHLFQLFLFKNTWLGDNRIRVTFLNSRG